MIASHRTLLSLPLALVLGVPGVALAQDDWSTGSGSSSGSDSGSGSGGFSEPRPATGFQLALRLGAAIPLGKATGDEAPTARP